MLPKSGHYPTLMGYIGVLGSSRNLTSGVADSSQRDHTNCDVECPPISPAFTVAPIPPFPGKFAVSFWDLLYKSQRSKASVHRWTAYSGLLG